MIIRYYKNFKFLSQLNRFKIYYKILEKSKVIKIEETKVGVTKSSSMVLGVKKSKRINKCLSINIDIIL